MPPVVAIDGLSKRYGRKWAVRDISLDIQPGEVLGLLGPNGSGKTTILRTLTGYLAPSAGRISVAGFDMAKQSLEARRRVGYVLEDVPLYQGMRVDEFLKFMAGLRGLSGGAVRTSIERVVAQLSLAGVTNLAIAKLSRGYRQRLMIAQALLGEPELLVLDEPTNGLDPRQIIEVRELIRSLSKRHTIVITSHILSEIEKVASRVAILLDGRLLAVHDLGRQTAIRLRTRQSSAAGGEAVDALLKRLPAVETVANSQRDGNDIRTHHVVLASRDAISEIARAVQDGGHDLLEICETTTNLEGLFLELTDGARA
jgi:ABC-2 type transport system ATP-binding protein